MKKILFLLLLIVSYNSYSQQSKIDSLSILFHKAKVDTTKAKILSDIGVAAYYTNRELAITINDSLINFSKNKSEKYLSQGYRMKGTFAMLNGDYNEAEESYFKALYILKKISNKKGVAALYSNLGTLYGRQKNNEKSKEFHLKSIEENNKNGYENDNLNSYFNLGVTAFSQNNLIESTEYYYIALKIAENLNNQNYVAYANNRIGINYLKLEQFERAESSLKKALKVFEKLQDNYGLAEIHNSFGYFFETRDNDYKQALFHYSKAYYYSDLTGNKIGVKDHAYNVGLQYLQLKSLKEAEKYFNEGLAVSDSIQSKEGKIIGNLHLAHLAIEKGNINKSENYFRVANNLYGNDSKMNYKFHFYRIADAYASKNIYKPAFDNMKTYAILADSLFKKNSTERIAEIETKYETEKKEKENLQLKNEKIVQALELEKESKRKWYLAIGLIASLITLGVFGYFYQQNKKKKELIENLQRELHHRIKNNLAIIDTFIDVAKDEFENEKFEDKLTELQFRIESINEVHQQLYLNKDVTNLSLKKYIENLSKNIEDSFSNKKVKIENNIDTTLQFNAEKSFPIGLIINEFLTNSFKYAFGNKDGLISIDIIESKDEYKLNLTDDGKGLPPNFDLEKTESFGIRVMKLLAEQLKGNFNLEGNNGVKVSIQFPKF